MRARPPSLVLMIGVALAVASLGVLGAPAAYAATCPAANPNDSIADDPALNACLNAGGTVSLAAGSPGYIVAQGLVLTKSGTVLGSVAAPKPTVIAAAGLSNALLRAEPGVHNITVDNIKFDGNRPNRTGIATKCAPGGPPSGNIQIQDSDWLRITNVISTRAMCGSAMLISGHNMVVESNVITDNGHNREALDAERPWADGMTIGWCHGDGATTGLIRYNTIVDATDIGIVLFASHKCTVSFNWIEQVNRYAFAGIGLHAPGPGQTAEHAGTIVRKNEIYGKKLMGFGISFGMHPWYGNTEDGSAAEVIGGDVRENKIGGAFINLYVDGVRSVNTPDQIKVAKVGSNTFLKTEHAPAGGCTGIDPDHPEPPANYARHLPHSQTVVLYPGWELRALHCVP